MKHTQRYAVADRLRNNWENWRTGRTGLTHGLRLTFRESLNNKLRVPHLRQEESADSPTSPSRGEFRQSHISVRRRVQTVPQAKQTLREPSCCRLGAVADLELLSPLSTFTGFVEWRCRTELTLNWRGRHWARLETVKPWTRTFVWVFSGSDWNNYSYLISDKECDLHRAYSVWQLMW